ncbi:PaaI family thioesterase [soil metagenome]
MSSHPISGFDFFTGIKDGTMTRPPMAELFGIDIIEVEKGFVALTATPRHEHYNPMQIVHGGYASVLLDTCMGGAIHSALEPGLGVVTLEYKINFVRPMTVKTGLIRGEGRVIHVGRTAATSEGRLMDPSGKLLAHGTTTCHIVPMPAA